MVPPATLLPELPLALRQRGSRVLGTAVTMLLVGIPVVIAIGAPQNWYQLILMAFLGGSWGVTGWRSLVRRLRLRRSGLTLNDGFRVYDVPWQRVGDIRLDDEQVVLTWSSDGYLRAGPFAAPRELAAMGVDGGAGPAGGAAKEARRTAERAAALMTRLRELSLAAGDPGVEVTARRGSAWTVAVLYAVAALASAYVWASR